MTACYLRWAHLSEALMKKSDGRSSSWLSLPYSQHCRASMTGTSVHRNRCSSTWTWYAGRHGRGLEVLKTHQGTRCASKHDSSVYCCALTGILKSNFTPGDLSAEKDCQAAQTAAAGGAAPRAVEQTFELQSRQSPGVPLALLAPAQPPEMPPLPPAATARPLQAEPTPEPPLPLHRKVGSHHRALSALPFAKRRGRQLPTGFPWAKALNRRCPMRRPLGCLSCVGCPCLPPWPLAVRS